MSPRTPEQNEAIRQESKHKILQAAFRLIAINGYEATSIAMIASEAGVSKGLLYNYFDSKEELVKAIVLSTLGEVEALLNEIVGESPAVTLKNIFQWFFREIKERPEHWKLTTELTFNIGKFDFVHDLVTTKITEFIAFIASLLTQMGHESPENEAKVIGALLDGIGFHALMMLDEYPLDEMERYLINKYCNKEK